MSHCAYCGKDVPEPSRSEQIKGLANQARQVGSSTDQKAEAAQPASQADPFEAKRPVFTVGDMERAVRAARKHEQDEAEMRTADAIDRDRVASFMQFARALPPNHQGIITGTSNQVRSIARALEKAGY